VLFSLTTYGAGVLQARSRARANSRTRRLGRLLRGVSCLLLTASIALLGIAFMHLGCAALMAQSTQCISNEKQLAQALLLYAQDCDERLPASRRWSEAISSRVREAAPSNTETSGDPFRCPAARSPASYGMNASLGGLCLSAMDAPASTVLLFDAEASIRSF